MKDTKDYLGLCGEFGKKCPPVGDAVAEATGPGVVSMRRSPGCARPWTKSDGRAF